jgi:hypothetical protein
MYHITDRDHQKHEGQALSLPSAHHRPTTRESRHLAPPTRSPTSTERAQILTSGRRRKEVARSNRKAPPTVHPPANPRCT